MKLSQYARQQGIRYSTALRWWHQGVIRGYQAPSGTIIVATEAKPQPKEEHVVIYACVSSPEHHENLERQVERLTHYCTMRGYQVSSVVKEIASGVNESRPKLLALLRDQQTRRIVVEHQDRLTRFGFRSLETIQERTIEVVYTADNDKDDLIADLVAIMYSLTAQLYGPRRAKRQTERIVQALQTNGQKWES